MARRAATRAIREAAARLHRAAAPESDEPYLHRYAPELCDCTEHRAQRARHRPNDEHPHLEHELEEHD
jgi:hypothetical protein